MSGGYTFTDSEITSGTNEGQVLTNTPDHKLTADLTWAINDRWSTTLEGEYYSSRERFVGDVSGESRLAGRATGQQAGRLRAVLTCAAPTVSATTCA